MLWWLVALWARPATNDQAFAGGHFFSCHKRHQRQPPVAGISLFCAYTSRNEACRALPPRPSLLLRHLLDGHVITSPHMPTGRPSHFLSLTRLVILAVSNALTLSGHLFS